MRQEEGLIAWRKRRRKAGNYHVRRIKQNSKAGLEKEDQAVMREQREVDEAKERLAKEYQEVFEGIGKYKGPPVEIQIKEGVRPVVQAPRRIPLHYHEPLRSCWKLESLRDRYNT